MRNPRRTRSCSIESVYMTTGDSTNHRTVRRAHGRSTASSGLVAKSEKDKPTAAVFKKGDSTRKHFRSIKPFG